MAKKNQSTENSDDIAMANVRAIWAEKRATKMTQEDLGIAMGYDEKSARKSVSQFLKSHDPRISMLRRFAKAMGVPLSEIVNE